MAENPNWTLQHHVMKVATDLNGRERWGVIKGSTNVKDMVSEHGSRSSAHRAAKKLNGPAASALRASVLRENET